MARWQAIALLLLLWAGMYLPGLGSRELRGEEPRRVLPAREMIQSGHWLIPRIAGQEYFRKPPGINWSVAASFLLTGSQDEWAARLPSVLGVLACGLGFLLLGEGVMGRRSAFLAAFFFLASVGMLEKARLIEIEALYVSLFGLAWLVWWSAIEKERPWQAWLLAMALLGGGMVIKGPLHVFYFYVLAISLSVAHRNRFFLLHPAHLVGWLVFAAVAAPWFWLSQERMAGATGPSGEQWEVSAVWWQQLAERMTFDTEVPLGHWIRQTFQGWLNFLPWVALVPLGFWRWRRGDVAIVESRRRFLALFWGLVIAYFAIAILPTSRPRFTLHLIIPVCLLAGELVGRGLGERGEKIASFLGAMAGLVGAVVAIVASLGIVVYTREKDFSWAPGVEFGVAALLLASFTLLYVARSGRRAHRDYGLVLHLGLGLVSVSFAYAYLAEAVLSHRMKFTPVAEAIEAHLPPDRVEPVVLLEMGYMPQVFYFKGPVEEWGSRNDPQEARPDYLLLFQDELESSRGELEALWGAWEELAIIEDRHWSRDRPYVLMARSRDSPAPAR
ncbi:MAG: glycosyltransferase family 39 protein [Verrucomicrobiota bacterium]